MKPEIKACAIITCVSVNLHAEQTYWNSNTELTPFRLPMAAFDAVPEYEDLDGDGDPDMLRINLSDGRKVQWIDDDDDMRASDSSTTL